MPMPAQGTVVDGLDRPKEPWKGLTVSDGGLYDNLGIQPALLDETILVSDGGEPFVASTPKDLFARLNSYVEILSNRVGALRVNDLIANYGSGKKRGTYWGVGSARERYRPDDRTGYSKALATEVISQIRTDTDSFSDAEIFVLMNHGYLLADIAIEVHAPDLKSSNLVANPPFPDWLDEAKVRGALAHSQERWWLGHRG
jgi:NTE family protein